MSGFFGGLNLWATPGRLAALVGVVTGLVFFPAVECGFVNWDDDTYVYENPLVLSGVSAAGIGGALDAVVCHHWAPLTILSYQLDVTLFGPLPAGFHVTNVLLHACTAAVLCLAVARMTGEPLKSAAATAFFALHPLRVESVAWISERKDVLSMLFLCLALLAYERYCRRPGLGRMSVVTLVMGLGLLAKATLVTLPVLLLLLDIWPLRRATVAGIGAGVAAASLFQSAPWPRLIREKLPLFFLSALMVAATLLAQQRAIEGEERMPLVSARLPNALHAVGWYLWKTVLPLDLMALYRHPGATGWPASALVASVALIAALAAAAWVLRRSVPAAPIGMAWFLVAVSPVLGIVAQAGTQAHADRCTYIPHIGLSWAIVWGAAWLRDRCRMPAAAATAACLAALGWFVLLDQRQIRVWNDGESLWRNVLVHDPECTLACNNLGVFLYESDRPAEAIPFLERAVAVPRPDRRYLRNLEIVRAALAE